MKATKKQWVAVKKGKLELQWYKVIDKKNGLYKILHDETALTLNCLEEEILAVSDFNMNKLFKNN